MVISAAVQKRVMQQVLHPLLSFLKVMTKVQITNEEGPNQGLRNLKKKYFKNFFCFFFFFLCSQP